MSIHLFQSIEGENTVVGPALEEINNNWKEVMAISDGDISWNFGVSEATVNGMIVPHQPRTLLRSGQRQYLP